VLPLLGLYEPPWEDDAKVLAQDYSAHLLFGVITGATFWVLARQALTSPGRERLTIGRGCALVAALAAVWAASGGPR